MSAGDVLKYHAIDSAFTGDFNAYAVVRVDPKTGAKTFTPISEKEFRNHLTKGTSND
jgi:hypothetical protein